MAESDSTNPSPPLPTSLSSKKENVVPIGSKITELNESRSELLTRIQGLKQDLQSWRFKLDTQVKTYRDELTDLKKSLNVEVDQLRSLQDISEDGKEAAVPEVEEMAEELQVPATEENGKETHQ